MGAISRCYLSSGLSEKTWPLHVLTPANNRAKGQCCSLRVLLMGLCHRLRGGGQTQRSICSSSIANPPILLYSPFQINLLGFLQSSSLQKTSWLARLLRSVSHHRFSSCTKMAPPLRTVLLDLAHERTVHSAYDIVSRRLHLEPVKSFIVEDLLIDQNSLKIVEQ